MTRAESRTLDNRIRRLAEWSGAPGTVCPRLSVTAIAARVGLERTAVSHRLARMGIHREAPPPANRVPDEIRAGMLADLANGFRPDTVAAMASVSLRTAYKVAREAR